MQYRDKAACNPPRAMHRRTFAPLRLCGMIFLLHAAPLGAAPPAWWSDAGTKILDTENPATTGENYAPANLGQLKQVAKQAKAHLDSHLPGEAGTAINDLVANFEPKSGQSYTPEELAALRAANYAPINLGQIKAVAKLFYDRLLSSSYDTKANLVSGAHHHGRQQPDRPAGCISL